MTPTQRSLAHLRAQGMVCAVVERWNPHAKIRQDLFGCLDLLCLAPSGETVGVQTTSYANVSARVKKIAASEHIAALRKCNWRLLVHGWSKDRKTKHWKVREVDVS